MTKNLCLVLALSSTFTFFGQNTRFESDSEPGFLYFAREGGLFLEEKEITVKGSHYIDPKFEPSKVNGYDGTTPLMRYNAYKDEIEFIDSNKVYYLIKTDSTKVKLSNKLYTYMLYNDGKDNQRGYLLELLHNVNSKFSVFKKEKIVFVPEYVPSSTYQEAKPAYYKKEGDKYYLGVNGTVYNMPTKKKDFIALLPNHNESIESFIKDNKISFKNENDFIKLLNFMNTL